MYRWNKVSEYMFCFQKKRDEDGLVLLKFYLPGPNACTNSVSLARISEVILGFEGNEACGLYAFSPDTEL